MWNRKGLPRFGHFLHYSTYSIRRRFRHDACRQRRFCAAEMTAMGSYPTVRRDEFIAWCRAHAPAFNEHADEIGLSQQQAADFGLLADTAWADMVAQETALLAYRAATETVKDSVRQLRVSAGTCVRLVRAFAEARTDPLAVLNLARLQPAADAAPAPPPATPRNLRASLDASTGAMTVSWKCAQPAGTSGTTYLVSRRLAGELGFSFLGASGRKVFVDDTLPAGIKQVEYIVRGNRGTRAGAASPILLVRMGATGAGATARYSAVPERRLHVEARGLARR